ncbi:J domain-containing protein [Oceanimonas marisflavi]|uniref:J domain-containing protein n=1 Tax=Oceanimonas marisflavi TaxID=2059724 RepID=UPI000D2F96AA|nr:J domain-containing protein [Oceanimonas marisflavi]
MTRLATTKLKSKKPAKHSPAGQFQLLWEKIDKQKTRLAGQEKRVRKIVDRFNAEILPLEQELARSQYRLIERLLTFLSRKSLTQWQRDDLLDWIQQELGVLSSNPFTDPELDTVDLLHRFEILLKQYYPKPEPTKITESERDQLRDDVYRELGLELNDDDIDLFMHSPTDFLQQMMKNIQEEGEDGPEEDNEEDNICGAAERTDGQAVGKALINRLYKQLAKKLHPDREQDPELKTVKQEQMQQLQAARQENDIHTLLELHHRHLDASALDPKDLHDINELLRRQLHELEWQYEAVFMNNSLESVIWNRFRHSSGISSNSLFAEHSQALKAGIQHNNRLLKELKALKELKQRLQEDRYFDY